MALTLSGTSKITPDQLSTGAPTWTADGRCGFLVGFPGYTLTAGSTYYKTPAANKIWYDQSGGAFNTTTMEFTAPVDGLYMFMMQFLRSASANVFRAHFYKNNATFGPQYRTSEGFSNYNETTVTAYPIYLLAGDKVDLRISADTAGGVVYADTGGLYNIFGGYLIG
jgi:hypothetical protein